MTKKSVVITVLAIIVLIASVYILGSGFRKESSVYIDNYSVSEDGSEMTIHVGIGSSIGFVRKASISYTEDGTAVITFYSAFGGIDGSIGAKNEYTIPINDDVTRIAIYRNSETNDIVIEKNEDGTW